MITRCPECGTRFRISVDIIRAEDSTVRCGDCMAVFDARSQLVDEASESTYLVDNARERASRLRQQQHQAGLQQPSPTVDEGISETAAQSENQDIGHGQDWVRPDWEIADEYPSQATPAGHDAVGNRQQPRGHMIIDRRESSTDLDLADTIAYRPISETGAGVSTAQVRHAPGEVSSVAAERTGRDVTQRGSDVSQVVSNYSRRIDPVINPDDRTIEFERTLALEGLSGIEPQYPERRTDQQVVENAAQNIAETAINEASASNARTSAYVGEHQFDTSASYSVGNPETRGQQTSGHAHVDLDNDPDIVNRPIGPPRSERHLVGQQHGGDNVSTREDAAGSDQSEHYLQDRAGTRQDRSESATAMRQHVNERGVAFDVADDIEVGSEKRSSSLGWALLALLAVGCAAALYARDEIAKSN